MTVTRKSPKSPAKTAPKTAAKRAPKKTAAPKRTPKVAATGPKTETLAFAARVVALRDGGASWAEVAEAVGIDYSSGYSSKLRRAYSIGGGETAGVRTRANLAKREAEAEAEAKASRSAARKAKRGTRGPSGRAASTAKRETATERRARLGRESVAS